jgi:hypothetical protein
VILIPYENFIQKKKREKKESQVISRRWTNQKETE